MGGATFVMGGVTSSGRTADTAEPTGDSVTSSSILGAFSQSRMTGEGLL